MNNSRVVILLPPCQAVLDTVSHFKRNPSLRHLTEDWKMFGACFEVERGTGIIDLLVRCGMTHATAKRAIRDGAVASTHLGASYFVLSNKKGNKVHGLFKTIEPTG